MAAAAVTENYDSIFFFMGRANPPTMGHINAMYKLLELAVLQTTNDNPLPMIFLSKTSNSERLRTLVNRRERQSVMRKINRLHKEDGLNKETLINSIETTSDDEPVIHKVKFVSAEKKSKYPNVKHQLHENPLDFETKRHFVNLLLKSYVKKKANEIREQNSMLADRLLEVYRKLQILPATGLYHCFGQVAAKAYEQSPQVPSSRIYYMYGDDERKVGPKTCLQICSIDDDTNSLHCHESRQTEIVSASSALDVGKRGKIRKQTNPSAASISREMKDVKEEAAKNVPASERKATTVFASVSGYMCVPLSRTQGEGANISGSGIRLLAAGEGDKVQNKADFKDHYKPYLSSKKAEELFQKVHSGITEIATTKPITRLSLPKSASSATAESSSAQSSLGKRKPREGGTRKKKRKKGKTHKNKKKARKKKRKSRQKRNFKKRKSLQKKNFKKRTTRRKKIQYAGKEGARIEEEECISYADIFEWHPSAISVGEGLWLKPGDGPDAPDHLPPLEVRVHKLYTAGINEETRSQQPARVVVIPVVDLEKPPRHQRKLTLKEEDLMPVRYTNEEGREHRGTHKYKLCHL